MPPVLQKIREKKRRLDNAVAGTSKIRSFFVTTTPAKTKLPRAIQKIAKAMRFTLPQLYQCLKTKQRRNQRLKTKQRRNQNGRTSNGGTNNVGTNNDGTNNGGTNNGGTNNDGTNNGGKNNDGTNNGGTSTTWTGSSGVRPDARQPDGCWVVERQARQGPQMRYCLWAPECVETPLDRCHHPRAPPPLRPKPRRFVLTTTEIIKT